MKKKVLIIMSLILILSLGIYIYKLSNQIYGNDIESIKAIISNQERIDGKIDVFDMVDIEGYRMVGYFEGNSQYDGNMGLAIFKANKNGDYVLDYLYRGLGHATANDRIYVDSFTLYKENQSETMYDIIISNNPNLAKVERIINNKYGNTLDITHNPSVSLMKLPQTVFNSEPIDLNIKEPVDEKYLAPHMTSSYYYYDVEGNELNGKPLK